MRAVVVKQHGGPDVLTVTDLAAPQAAPGCLVVDVEAAGVNFMDIYQRQGSPSYAVDLPYVPGTEGAGTVVAAGPGVTGFATGDKVAWTGVAGSYAERVAIPADRAVPIPDGVRPRVAAAVMLQGLTAHYLANSTYPIAAGDPVVVHAAAGGVGLLLTQLVKMRAGMAIATTSTADKAELARRAGADHVIDYEDFATAVREITDGVGRATFDEGLTALRPRGYLVLYGAASGPVPPLELQRLAGGGSLFVTRPTLVHHIASRAELLRRANDLFTWIRQGRLEVRIGGTYPLDDAAWAHDDLAARRTTGKLLLLPR
ncbi:quinone oxidoreductase [Frankia sp. CiP3]|uniref:quinone oxidoreductase family protein n=1 Tax=Frankia sp. CiP3 TaxID=2880971 RepID=UPI001EF50A17|nr:quinone oxidoreductase [Frankia sp. CiP3]